MNNTERNYMENLDKENPIAKRLDCYHSYYAADDNLQEELLCDMSDCICNGCYQSGEE